MNIEQLLNDIEVQYATKSAGIASTLIPTIVKILFPKTIWDAFLNGEYCDPPELRDYSEKGPHIEDEEKMFRRCVEHHVIDRIIEKRVKRRQWVEETYRVVLNPNIGGIPVELGKDNKVVVIVEGKPPVKRIFRKRQYENLNQTDPGS